MNKPYNWHPIEKIPNELKDGRDVILLRKSGKVDTQFYLSGAAAWSCGSSDDEFSHYNKEE